jgi:hypothetical protein
MREGGMRLSKPIVDTKLPSPHRRGAGERSPHCFDSIVLLLPAPFNEIVEEDQWPAAFQHDAEILS